MNGNMAHKNSSSKSQSQPRVEPQSTTPVGSPTLGYSQSPLMSSSEPVIDKLTPAELEQFFRQTLKECNSLCQSEGPLTREVAMAKMVNYCIRMLHSHEWVPATVIRAMVHFEAGETAERSVKGLLYMSMREKRDEGRARKALKNGKLNGDTNGHIDAGRNGGSTSNQTGKENLKRSVPEQVTTKTVKNGVQKAAVNSVKTEVEAKTED